MKYNTDPNAGGIKYDEDKVRLELLPAEALWEIGKVFTHGATKYADDQWRKGMSWRRVYGAALRHLVAWGAGETFDPDSGCHHLAHVATNAMFLLTYWACGLGTDDRVGVAPVAAGCHDPTYDFPGPYVEMGTDVVMKGMCDILSPDTRHGYEKLPRMVFGDPREEISPTYVVEQAHYQAWHDAGYYALWGVQ
jgi:hypothetical protein